MDPFTIAIVLIAVGAVFLIIEAFSPGAFMVVPGAVLVILGLVGAAAPDVLASWWACVIVVVITIPVTAVTVVGYRKLAEPAPPTTTVTESLLGREGVVVTATEPGTMRGKVRIGNDIWSATSDEIIAEGTRVRVDRSEGVHVHVSPVTE